MLHIHNGDSTANTLKEFDFPGDHIAFQEVLMAGPTPRGLSAAAWQEVRAKFLSEEYELRVAECQKRLVEQDAALRSFSEHEETILWFEHDLWTIVCSRNSVLKCRLTTNREGIPQRTARILT